MTVKLSIFWRSAAAVLMIGALVFLTTANFWAYGWKQSKQQVSASNNQEEEPNSNTNVPNPVEEKNSNSLQNLSEYLHDHEQDLKHQTFIAGTFGNRHDIIKLPIHHPELLTPPPKA